jgi:hypothetical protein
MLEGTNACFAPLLRLSEAAAHPHTVARETIVEIGGIRQAAPVPRLSRTAGRLSRPPALFGQETVEVLTDWGFDPERVRQLLAAGAVTQLPDAQATGRKSDGTETRPKSTIFYQRGSLTGPADDRREQT